MECGARRRFGSSRTAPALRAFVPFLPPSLLWSVILIISIRGVAASTDASPHFSRDILPILSDHCFACHGPDTGARKGGLRLDTREGAVAPAKSGRHAVVPHQSHESELIRRIQTTDPNDRMPPDKSNKPLTPDQIRRLVSWIDSGAGWGRHWAYDPIQAPRIASESTSPSSYDVVHPIDFFILSGLKTKGLRPSPEASRETLIRRVTLDLTGLPPSPSEIDAFLADSRPDAWERLVDRLLASPRYGERMAWEWLDAARYADSNGYQGDAERTMWPWRDWVVEALNRNLPFDTFTLWQLAGDLFPTPTDEQRLATGFLRNHMINGEGGRIPEENRIDYLFDQTETVGTVWLGATLNCTRCHNHKFDPLTQREYFGLLAFFNRTAVDGSGGDPQSRPHLEWPTPEQTAQRRAAEERLAEIVRINEQREQTKWPRPEGKTSDVSDAAQDLPQEIRDILKLPVANRDSARLEKLAAHCKTSDSAFAEGVALQRKLLAERDAAVRAIPRVMIMQDVASPRDTFVLNRGLYTQPAEKVSPSLPAAISPYPLAGDAPPNRLTLARWLVSHDHPLTARVTVNRAWQTFFGIGLVKTTEDFGVQGEKPSHPELLDWLASEFMATGWDLKRLHRLIVTSATYRQSSGTSRDTRERDPENRYLARGARFRMPSWMIRDAALAASGLLIEQRGGPPVRPYQPTGVWEEATFGNKRYTQDHGSALYRRSLYVFWRRIVAPTLFFDVASRQTCTVRTPRTNVPLHALLTLNDVTYVEAARALAQHTLTAPLPDRFSRIAYASRRVLGRNLTASERAILERALHRHLDHFVANPDATRQWLAHGEFPQEPMLKPTELAAWTALCSTLLNLDEALTRE